MQTKDKPSEHDRIIGQNLRNIRFYRDLSQNHLAQKIGITFQQVQKYEKAINRISGGRLIDLSDALDVPITAFFDGIAPLMNTPEKPVIPKQHFQILNLLSQIDDPEFEVSILNLCKNRSNLRS